MTSDAVTTVPDSADRGVTRRHPAGFEPILADRAGVHLALGGGAARGLAHIGVLKVLQAHDVPIASICGTSMGALIGCIYALHPNAEFVETFVTDFIRSDAFHRARFSLIQAAHEAKKKEGRFGLRYLFNHGVLLGRTMTRGSMVPFEEFHQQVAELIPDKTFADTRIPFFSVSVDLTHRIEVVFNSGSLRSAIMASSAIPGVFPSVLANGTVYIDGGWMNKVPVGPLKRLGARSVLGVDVSDDPPPEINPKRGLSVIFQAYAATNYRLQQLQMNPSAIIWRPDVHILHWSDFFQIEFAIAAGHRCATARIGEVKDLLERVKKRPTWRRRLVKWLCANRPDAPQLIPFELREIDDIDAIDVT